MNTGTIIIIIIAGILLLLVGYAVSVYNKLVNARNKVDNQFSQIDIQLKRRSDLIPNLIETVKGYAKHETETFETIVNARNGYANAKTTEEKVEAANQITKGINGLLALAESYPELKANTNFLDLQNQLKEIEDKISYARQFYNDAVMSYNNKIQMFPSSFVANMFHFTAEKFFEADEQSRENVKVEF